VNRDDIIRMAREAGLLRSGDAWTEPHRWGITELERFAALVAEPLQSRITDLYRQLGEAEKQLDRQYAMGIEAERDRCILILEHLHEQAGDRHNYYLHAVKVLKGEV
jgi:hypothetical protein